MRLRCALLCVGRNPDVAIRPILEAHRARQPGCQFPMYLALGGTCSNRDPCQEVGEVMRGDDVEELAPGRPSAPGEVQTKPARPGQPAVARDSITRVQTSHDTSTPTYGKGTSH